MAYKISVFDSRIPDEVAEKDKKILTYLPETVLSDSGSFPVYLERLERMSMGLTPTIYNGISGLGQDKDDWLGYSADPFRDHVDVLAKRIILW